MTRRQTHEVTKPLSHVAVYSDTQGGNLHGILTQFAKTRKCYLFENKFYSILVLDTFSKQLLSTQTDKKIKQPAHL